MKLSSAPIAALLLSALLAACGGNGATSGKPGEGDGDAAGLPTPSARGGSITGMPDPRPGGGNQPAIDIAPEALPDPATEGDGTGPEDISASEPGADSAVQVIRDYYAAINLRDPARAYALWRGQGQASGVSAEQFAQDLSTTSGVSVEIGQPGPVDAGAGQRHITIPVSLVVRKSDGGEQRYRGEYVLQRTVVDGASEDQRAWRISSARLTATP